MDALMSQVEDKIPAMDKGLFDDTLEKMKTTQELVENPKVQEKRPEEAEKLAEGTTAMIALIEPINKISYFIKDNEEAKEKITLLDGILIKINDLLLKVSKFNCLNEACIKVKVFE